MSEENADFTPPPRRHTGEHPMARVEERNWFRGLVLGMVAMCSLGGFGVWLLGGASAKAEKVARDLTEHKAEELQIHAEMRSQAYEQRVDFRELYRASRERRRSERLEKPLPPPDGGP